MRHFMTYDDSGSLDTNPLREAVNDLHRQGQIVNVQHDRMQQDQGRSKQDVMQSLGVDNDQKLAGKSITWIDRGSNQAHEVKIVLSTATHVTFQFSNGNQLRRSWHEFARDTYTSTRF